MSEDKHNKKDLRKDIFFFRTTGFSMWPFLKPGEKLVIKKVPPESLRIGDLILYQADSQIVCHRLVMKIRHRQGQRQWLYVRGDNSLSLPQLITEQMLMGKAIGIIRSGKMVNTATEKQRFINLVIVIIAPLVSLAARLLKSYYVRLCKPGA